LLQLCNNVRTLKAYTIDSLSLIDFLLVTNVPKHLMAMLMELAWSYDAMSKGWALLASRVQHNFTLDNNMFHSFIY
jgi:hypothetical protein